MTAPMGETSDNAEDRPGGPTLDEGTVGGACHAVFAFDLGFHVDLESARRLVRESERLSAVRVRRPSPAWFEYDPLPLRATLEGDPLSVAGLTTDATVECVVYDFGAAVLTYRLPLEAPVESLPGVGAALFDNATLLTDARRRAEALLGSIRPAVSKPALSDIVEDYFIFALRRWERGATPGEVLDRHADALAHVLQAETGELTAQQIDHTIGARMGYSSDDLAVVDWNGALLLDPAPEDVIALLQHANVELLEMRVLDRSLDGLLEGASDLLSKVRRPTLHNRRLLRSFAELQTDSALLFEGVNNAIKLMGNQYLARLYRLAAGRLDLPEWHASVQRKIAVAESVYQKMTDARAAMRMEVLEIIIILLIAVSILMPFLGLPYAK